MPPPPVPRALRTLTTLFGVGAILALGVLLLRLLGASRQGWALGAQEVAVLALDLGVFAVNAFGFVTLRRAWARAASVGGGAAGEGPPVGPPGVP